MKSIPDMRSGMPARGFAALLLGWAMLLSMGNANSDAIVQTAGGVSYVSGGVGADSMDQLNAIAGNFNVKLVFALQSGNYVSDVRVAIADAKGKTLLDTTSAGPWFLARLPVGNYQIVATFAGNAIKRQVAVGTAKLQTIDLRWASE